MGKNSTPQYNAPAPPKLKTADELYGSATNYAKTNQPLAYGAREGALKDLQDPTSYYAGFQPTSFEQALGNQYFQNVEPQAEDSIKHALSLSGLDSSPLLASLIGKQAGQTRFDIGSYLSNQANDRATGSLNARLGINPDDVLGGYLRTDTNQSNSQNQLDYDYQQQLAQIQYQQAIDKYNQQQALYKMIGAISPVGGAIYGGINGGSGGLTTALSGTLDSAAKFAPMALPAMAGANGLAGMFNSSPSVATPATPTASSIAGMTANPYNYGMQTSQYNPTNYFPGFTGRGGAV